MAYKIEVSAKAKGHLKDIYQWIATSWSPVQAREQVGELEKAILSLSELPARCPLAPENKSSREEIRHLVHGKGTACHRILFAIMGETVVIHTVRHGRRGLLE